MKGLNITYLNTYIDKGSNISWL